MNKSIINYALFIGMMMFYLFAYGEGCVYEYRKEQEKSDHFIGYACETVEGKLYFEYDEKCPQGRVIDFEALMKRLDAENVFTTNDKVDGS